MGVPKELGPQGHLTQGSAQVLLASSQYLMLAQWSSTSHSRMGTHTPATAQGGVRLLSAKQNTVSWDFYHLLYIHMP